MFRTIQLKTQFSDFIREQGLKWTPEREEVLQETLRTEGHFEAEDLAFNLRKKGSRVSKATVYRTLPLLVKGGLIKEAIYGEKHQHYEHVHAQEHHDHLICLKCGRIVEFSNGSLKRIKDDICKENRFRPQKILFEIFGYCRKCQ